MQLCRAVIEFFTENDDAEPPRRRVKTHRSADVSDDLITQDVEWMLLINRWLPGAWADANIADKAVKSDDSPVDFRPWHRRIQMVFPCQTSTLGVLERLVMRRWRSNALKSSFNYLSQTYGTRWRADFFRGGKRTLRDTSSSGGKRCRFPSGATSDTSWGRVDAVANTIITTSDGVCDRLRSDIWKGMRVLGQVLRSTWWEWTHGSAPLFWQWNRLEQITAARDGMATFVQSTLPRSRKGVKRHRLDVENRKLVSSKIQTMLSKSYLEVGFVRTSLHYFSVPKGEDDIRVVFDGTSCGLNEALWSPNFFLPTSRNASEMLSFDTWMSDADFGEFFHNLFADERVRKHSGEDVTPMSPFLKLESEGGHNVDFKFNGLRWERLFMGSKPSATNAVRFYDWGEEFAMGNLRDVTNPFGFDAIILNLPGLDTYDTTKPKLMKWNSVKNGMAGDVVTFVDDVRMIGSSRERCRYVHRQFSSQMQYLGIQDAPRKLRPPSQSQAGAWT